MVNSTSFPFSLSAQSPNESEKKTLQNSNPRLRKLSDVYEKKTNRVGVRRLLKPSPRIDTVSVNDVAQILIHAAPHTLKFESLKRTLECSGSGEQTQLWSGICLRICGESAKSTLAPLTASFGYGRIAFLNTIADHLTRTLPSHSQSERYLAILSPYTVNNQADVFARLLHSMLHFAITRPNEALELIEGLYTDYPDYSPAISVMASFLTLRGLGHGALSFALEALKKNDDNAQAYAIVKYFNLQANWDEVQKRFSHVRRAVPEVHPCSILYCKYGMLDPLCVG